MERTDYSLEKNTELVDQARDHVTLLFNKHHRAQLVFHNYSLTCRCVNLVTEIAYREKTDPRTRELAVLTSWFLLVGYQLDAERPTARAIREMGHFFAEHSYPEAMKQRAVACLQTVAHHRPALAEEEQLLSDAYQVAAFLNDFPLQIELLRFELEQVQGRLFSSEEWEAFQQEKLLGIKLYTPYAKLTYGDKIGVALLELEQGQKKKQRKTIVPKTGRFVNLESTTPNRGAQTLFRTNYRNHINLSAIADNKANIMISVNAILISVLITFLSYRNIAETNPAVLLPVMLFLVTGLSSLIFAVLSARPKVTRPEGMPDRGNMLFFGSFTKLEIEDYEVAMDEILHEESLLYGNMVRDLYYLGKVLDKKYRYLTLSYNIFMLGFTMTVAAFLFILLT